MPKSTLMLPLHQKFNPVPLENQEPAPQEARLSFLDLFPFQARLNLWFGSNCWLVSECKKTTLFYLALGAVRQDIYICIFDLASIAFGALVLGLCITLIVTGFIAYFLYC